MFYVIVLLLSFFFFFSLCPTWAAIRVKTCSTFLGLCPLFFVFFFKQQLVGKEHDTCEDVSHYYLAHGCGLVACGVCTLGPGEPVESTACGCVCLEGLSLCLEVSTQPRACADGH